MPDLAEPGGEGDRAANVQVFKQREVPGGLLAPRSSRTGSTSGTPSAHEHGIAVGAQR